MVIDHSHSKEIINERINQFDGEMIANLPIFIKLINLKSVGFLSQ